MRRYDILEPAEGTCQWLANHPSYKQWSSEERGLLWINGNPGAGKSTIMAHALNLDASLGDGGKIVLSFFFHGRGTDLQKNLHGLYRTLLHQLLVRYPQALWRLTSMYTGRLKTEGKFGENWQWDENELLHILKSQLHRAAMKLSVKIYVDALDEAGEDNAKKLVLVFRDLDTRSRLDDGKLRICFSCRHYPLMRVGEVPQICVEHENLEDIKHYISSKTSDLQTLDKSNSSMDPIRLAMLSKAAGSFQWVKMILGQIEDQHRNEEGFASMMRTVQSNPGDLSALYRALLLRISEKDKPYALRLFQWICFAVRPLNMNELRVGLVLDLEHTSIQECQIMDHYVASNRAMERRLRFLSAGLAETSVQDEHILIWSGKKGHWTTLHAPVVQLVHQSVFDFLVDEGFQILSLSSIPDILAASRCLLLRLCFCRFDVESMRKKPKKYIQQDFAKDFADVYGRTPLEYYEEYDAVYGDSVSDKIDKKLPRETWELQIANKLHERVHLPLLLYASDNWVEHLKRACKDNESIEALSPALFGARSTFERHLEPGKDHWWSGRSILHIAAQYDLELLFRAGVSHGLDPNIQDSDGKTALFAACEHMHPKMVLLLLQLDNVDVNIPDRWGRTPLYAFDYREQISIELYGLLLAHPDTDVNQRNEDGMTISMFIHHINDQDIEDTLLSRENLDINLAVRSEHEFGLRSTPSIQSSHQGFTALHFAVLDNCVRLVKLLLHREDLDITMEDSLGTSALAVACYYGHEEVAQLLLEHPGTDCASTTDEGFTPLMFASYSRDDNPLVRILLDNGVDVNAKDERDRTALWYASSMGYVKNMITLLAHHAHMGVESTDGTTALHQVVKAKEFQSIEPLLEAVTNANSSEDDIRHHSLYQNISVIELLLEARMEQLLELNDASSLFKTISTNLQSVREQDQAEERKSLDIFQYCLSIGLPSICKFLFICEYPEISVKNSLQTRRHHESCSYGAVKCIELAVGFSANPAIQRQLEETPLLLAIKDGHVACLPPLLGRVTNLDSFDGSGTSAIHFAVRARRPDLVSVLLDSGADPNSQNADGHTSLHLALADKADDALSCAVLLLKHGANVMLRDNGGRTSLLYALLKGHKSGIEALLEQCANLARVDLGDNEVSRPISTTLKLAIRQLRMTLCTPDNSGVTPLLQVASEGWARTLQLLWLQDSYNNDQAMQLNCEDKDGNTPLSIAVRKHFIHVVDFILTKGTDPNFQDYSYKNTALHWAVCVNDLAAVKLLLRYGADVNLKESGGHTPFSLLAYLGPPAERTTDSKDVSNSSGLDGDNVVGQSHTTPSWSDFKAIAQLLLDHGADLTTKDNTGRTPLEIARRRGDSFLEHWVRAYEMEKLSDSQPSATQQASPKVFKSFSQNILAKLRGIGP